MPACAIATAPATASSKFLGLRPDRTTPAPAALTGENESSAPIHFGIAASSPSRGRLCHCLAATAKSSSPSTSFSQLTQFGGAPDSPPEAPPANDSVIAPTIASPSHQPPMNAG